MHTENLRLARRNNQAEMAHTNMISTHADTPEEVKRRSLTRSKGGHLHAATLMTDPYAAAAASAARLAERTDCAAHDAAVILGSGWLPAADALGPADAAVALAELGGFAPPTVAGHTPVVRSVTVGGLRVLVFLGRTHLYEGLPVDTVVHGVRTAVAAGCRVVVLTNASGGIRAGLQPGQPVLISDHLNLTGRSPLAGPPPPAGYPARFTDLSDLYAARLRAIARAADPSLAEGVYAALPGPHYETPAEIRMLAAAGADLVGMSTALEAIAARHLGAEVLGLSLVTNIAAGLSDQPLDHAEVLATGQAAAARMGALLAGILPAIGPA
jgi:purine-nucleoside phosphorylase